MKKFLLLLMTSRSGSSMVADIVRRHGFYWADEQVRLPRAGGNKIQYPTFEHPEVKKFMRANFGMPEGDMITYDDNHVNAFRAILRMLYQDAQPNVWKGAAEFFPIWHRLAELEEIEIQPCIVYRPKQKVAESVEAKYTTRGIKVIRDDTMRILNARYATLERLASDYAIPLIETEQLVAGDFSSIAQAFETYGYDFDPSIAEATINPDKWEKER